jgi:hypothetical protein
MFVLAVVATFLAGVLLAGAFPESGRNNVQPVDRP